MYRRLEPRCLIWYLHSFNVFKVCFVPDNDSPTIPHHKMPYETRASSQKSDILDSISSTYEGTRKILADSEPRGPFYIPHDLKIDFDVNLARHDSKMGPEKNPGLFGRQPSTDLPHPTMDLGLDVDMEHVIEKRDAEMEPMLVNVSLLQYLDTGRWFLSVSLKNIF